MKYFSTIILCFLFVFASIQASAVARTWVGVGAGGAGTNFNASANWSPAGVPGVADDLTINISSNATVQVTASITVNSVVMTVTGTNVTGVLDIQTFTLTCNATSAFNATSGNANTRGILHAGAAPGKVIFNGDVNFNLTGTSLFKFRAAATNPGDLVFMANITTGTNAFTEPGDEPRFVFNKSGNQSWTFNSTANYIVPNSIIVGNGNISTTNFIGSGGATLINVYGGVVTVSDNCTLDLGKYGCDKFSGTGAITLGANSLLRIGTTNDFPSGFSTYNLDISSTVEYYGTSTTQDVARMPGIDNYGNLILTGGGSKQQTSIGGIRVRGNMTVASGTTYFAWDMQTTVDGTMTNSGIFNASTANQIFNGDFVNNGTWQQGTSGTSVAVFSGAAAQSVSGTTTNTAFYGMAVNNTSATGVTLNVPIEVIAGLILTDGFVYTSQTSLLILRDNCTSSPGSNATFVDGPLRKIGNDAFVFPLGNDGVWARLAITAPSNTAHHFTAQYFFSPYSILTPVNAPNQYVSSVEHWILDRTSGTSNVSVTLYWENGARSGINTFSNDLHVARWNGSAWVDHGSGTRTGSAAAGTLQTSAAVTNFSPFTFASVSLPTTNPLPIELISFNAVCEKPDIMIRWSTATESNNAFFTVEKTKDGVNFELVGTIAGAGNSNSVREYSFIDENPESGLMYYRLTQTDYNGMTKSFQMVPVQCTDLENFYFHAYTDENGNIVLKVNSQENETCIAILTDMQGRIITSVPLNVYEGDSKFILNIQGLFTGVYIVVLTNEKHRISEKLIIY